MACLRVFVSLFRSVHQHADLAISFVFNPQFAEADGVRFSLDSCDPLCLLLRAGTSRFIVVHMRLIGAGHRQQVDADEASFPRRSTPMQLRAAVLLDYGVECLMMCYLPRRHVEW